MRVSDLGTVRTGGINSRSRPEMDNRRPCNVSRQPAGNILRVERAVLAMADSLRHVLPKVKLESVQSGRAGPPHPRHVRDAIDGGVLAVILLLFPPPARRYRRVPDPAGHDSRTFVGLHLFGDSLNLMSLGGLPWRWAHHR